MRSRRIVKPRILAEEVSSISLLLITTGKGSGLPDLVKHTRISLHLSSFRINFRSVDLSSISSVANWILLVAPLGTSAIVVSSTTFQRSTPLALSSLIIRINSQGPSLVPCGTPAGTAVHSE